MSFLPALESPGFGPGEWRGGDEDEAGVMQMPWFELAEDARAFATASRSRAGSGGRSTKTLAALERELRAAQPSR